MSLALELSGGNPRSLGKTDEVVNSVLADGNKLGELFDCLFIDDEIVRMRTADALEKICRQRPSWFASYADRLLTDVAAIDQPSVQWHLAQMIGELHLSEAQRVKAIAILKRNLEKATDWIVLNYSLEVFAQFVRSDSGLRPYFVKQLNRHVDNHHRSVAKRANKLLADL